MKKDEKQPRLKQPKNKAAQSQKPILSSKQAAKLMRDNYVRQRNKKPAEQTQERTNETEYAIDNIEAAAYMAVDEVLPIKQPKTKSAKEPRPETKPEAFNYNDDVSAGESSKAELPQRQIPKQQPKNLQQQQPILKQRLKNSQQQQPIPKQQLKSLQQQQPIPKQWLKSSQQQQSIPKQQSKNPKQQKPKLKEEPSYISKMLEENPKTDVKREKQEPKSKPTTMDIKERQTNSNPLPEEIPRQGVICDAAIKPAVKEKAVYISPKNSRQDKTQNVQPNDAQFEPHFSDIPVVKSKPAAYKEKTVNRQVDFIQESSQNNAQFELYFEPAKKADNRLVNSYAKPKDVSPKNKPVYIVPKTRGAAYEKKSVVPKQQTFGRNKTAAKLAGKAKEQMQKKVQQTAGVSAEFSKRLVKFVAKTTTAIAKPLLAMLGGSIALIILAAIVLIAAVVSSPLGLFFAGERSAANAVSLAEAVASVNVAYNAKLEELQEGDYAGIEITGQAAAWHDVLAVFAVKVAGADVGGLDVVTLDSQRVELLKSVFWDMTNIRTETESTDNGEILKISVTAKSADDMRIAYAFSNYQNSALDELLAESTALIALAGSLDITNVDALTVLAALPDDLPEARRNVVQTALTLYGKVNYFWGGKSLSIGWDSRWGELRKVTAAGSRTTGSYRPFGLDCSGFVDWVFYNVTNGGYIIGHGGGAASQHDYCTDISWAEAMPGDLVFYLEDDHVGIVCGWDDSGNLLVIHCASAANNVVITGTSGFSFVARPDFYGD